MTASEIYAAAEPAINLLTTAALDYAARGWLVVPVHTPRANGAGPCSCSNQECASAGKHPRPNDWTHQATTNPDQIRAWWGKWPDANVGIAPGHKSGIFALDVDKHKGGYESLDALVKRHGPLPDTWTVHTGSGGLHLYFLWPEGLEVRNSESKIAAGLDIRGEGGFVVAPPSLHHSGRHYELEESAIPPVEPPAWLLTLLSTPPAAPAAQPRPAEKPDEPVTKGKRTKRLVSLAGSMHKRAMPPEAIEAALLKVNATFDPPLPEAKVRELSYDIPKRYPHSEPEAKPNGAVPQLVDPPEPAAPLLLTSELLLLCRLWIERFVVLSAHQAIVCAVWLLHTYVWEIASKTPYLHIYSAEKEEGKTQLVAALAALARAPQTAEEISTAALRRVPGQLKPTLFLDEMDAMMKGEKEKAETIRGLLNSGFRHKGCALLCAGKDKNFALERFPSFCPKVLAGIGQLWDTVAGRSIPIELHRMRPDQRVDDIDDDDMVEGLAKPVRAVLERWREWAMPQLKEIAAEKVPGLKHRQQNISKQPMQIVTLAGPEWTKALTNALQEIFKVAREQDDSIGVMLLSDIRAIFEERKVERLFSQDLSAALCALEGHPWQDWAKGKGLTPNRLATLLRPFHVYSATVFIGEKNFKGYKADQFHELWSRYLPPFQNVRTSEPAPALDETPFFKTSGTPPADVLKNA
jgi:hypothetical protein